MTLTAAIPFLKGAVQRGLPGGAPSVYVFDDSVRAPDGVTRGTCYARGAAMLASYPVAHILGTFSLAADDIEHALARMPSEPEIGAGDGTLILKSGRLRSSITLMAAEPPAGLIDPEQSWSEVPGLLFDAFRTAAPFVSPEGTWQHSVKLDEGCLMAVSNRAAIKVQVPGLSVGNHDVSLSLECIEYLAGMNDKPAGMNIGHGQVSFIWPNGAWVRCQTLSVGWPEGLIDKVLDGSVTDAPLIDLTPEWSAAYADVAALGDGDVVIGPEGMIGRSEHAEHRAEFDTGVTTESRWVIKTLKPIFACARSWHPDAPGPAPFAAPGIRGVVTRVRR